MRRALLVGIDAYPRSPLHGCVADATAVAETLRIDHGGAPNWRPTILLADSAGSGITREFLRDALGQLFASSRNHPSTAATTAPQPVTSAL